MIFQPEGRHILMEWHAMDTGFTKVHNPKKADDWSGVMWHNNVTDVPSDYPICGWQGELCQQQQTDYQLTIILVPTIFGCLALLILVVAIVSVIKYMHETNLKEVGEIHISWDDLRPVEHTGKGLASVHSLNNPIPPAGPAHGSDLLPSAGTVHGSDLNIVLYEDKTVMVHSLGNRYVNMEDRKVLVDLKNIRELAHDNVNPFVGICTDVPNVCYLMLYASRGSIEDIIADDSIHLSRDFQVSFILDIACGMWYLHQSPVEVHCHLTSATCVVDNRWTCKVTGHGLAYIKAQCGQTLIDYQDPSKLLWIAPEMLQKEHSSISSKTKKGDVFSFSIIAQEVFLKDLPYAGNIPQLSPEAIVERVTNGESPSYRPVIPTEVCSEKWRELIETCWNEDPNQRPTFDDILYSINSIQRYKNMDLVDNMVKRLEQYTHTLEERVIQRSNELQGEKNKVEILLCELLPPSVAQQLAHGHQVAPEAFDNVTIFFSDIVGFTRISTMSSPLEIVDMLNSMYSMFDTLAQDYDVYKVATIGDAYMVASGVPIRNGDKHAAEICALSLDLLDAIQDFPIEHIPGEHLSMRIGIFSGPCVAGVAGIKMPRYLLFGDTVDIAARMESGGEAMKIHIGYTTEQLIRNSPQFHLKLKGEMEIKLSLKVQTYWLERLKSSH